MIFLWEQKLENYFKTNLALDRETDEIRKKLLSQVSEDILFEAIDQDANGFLTISEFSQAIHKENKTVHWESLRRMVNQYDKSGEFSLTSKDFDRFLHFNGYVKDSNNNNENTGKEINDTTFALFIDLVMKEIEITKQLKDIADDIKKTKEFITYEAFRSIAGLDKYITETNLNAYLTKKGIEVKDKAELTKLIYRYDKNMDGYFGFNEFKSIFSPFSLDDTKAIYSLKREDTLLKASTTSPLIKKTTLMKLEDNTNSLLKANTNTNVCSRMSQAQGLIYDYSFEDKMLASDDENDYKKDIQSQREKLGMSQDKNSKYSPLINTYKKKICSALSLTDKYTNDNSPYKLKGNCSNSDLPVSNAKINNSFNNMSLSPYKGKSGGYKNFVQQAKVYPGLSQSQSVYQQSPCKDFNKQNSFNISQEYNKQNNNNNQCALNENKNFLIGYLNEIIIQELIANGVKEEILKTSNINIKDVFYFFDQSNSNKISPNDFKESLKQLSIFVTNNEIKLLLNRYDNDSDGYFDFNEFCEMLLPRKQKQEMYNGKHIMTQSQKEGLPLEVIPMLSNLFYALISNAKACNNKAIEMSSNDSFSNVECYDLIKSRQSNTIHKEDLHTFYDENNIQVTQFEMNLLMDYFDKDKDGQISFNEFARECSRSAIK